MNAIRNLFIAIVAMMGFLPTYSQIGYQVAVVDQETGIPKANKQVEVSISLVDNAGNIICTEADNLTTNDFGIISINV